MHRSLWLYCSCERRDARDHLCYNEDTKILSVHPGLWVEPKLKPTVSFSWYRVLKMPLKLLSDISAHSYWAQVPKYRSTSISVCTPWWKKTGSLLCATAAIQSWYEWLFFTSLTPAGGYLLEFHAAALLDFICCICNAILFPFKQIDH